MLIGQIIKTIFREIFAVIARTTKESVAISQLLTIDHSTDCFSRLIGIAMTTVEGYPQLETWNLELSSPMTTKDLFYFTGQCLSLDEHPEFREKIIELFADACNPCPDSNSPGGQSGALITNSSAWRFFSSLPLRGRFRGGWELMGASFVQLCSDHLVIPVIYLKFKKHGILELLPEELVETLQTIYELNRERNEQILRQIDDLTAVLNKENIQPVFLKGTANLLDGLYSDVGERMAHDIDFLVREEEYLRTAELLLKNGYQTEPNAQLDNRERRHYPILSKPGEVAPVEVHRMPVSKSYSAQFNAEMIFSRKKTIPGKPGLLVPSDSHKLIHTFIHGQLIDKGHAYKQTSFREIYDLYLLSKRTNVSQLASLNKYRNKAIAWLVFCQRVVNLPGRFYTPETNSAKLFCLKYNLSLTFIRMHNVSIRLKLIIHLTGKWIVGGFFKAIFDKQARKYIFEIVRNPKLFHAHWANYKNYFS